MGNHSASMTPPNAQDRQPPPGSQEAYSGIRFETRPGIGRLFSGTADAAAAAANAANGRVWVVNPPRRPQTVVQRTKMIKNTCHLHKDTLRLGVSREKETETGKDMKDGGGDKARYHLSFRFDSEQPCTVAVYWVARENKEAAGHLCHTPLLPDKETWTAGPDRFQAGHNQEYSTKATGYTGADLSRARQALGGSGRVGEPRTGGEESAAGKEGLNVYIVMRPSQDKDNVDGGGKEAEQMPDGDVRAQITLLGVNLVPLPRAEGGELQGEGRREERWEVQRIKQKIETNEGIYVLQEIYGIAGTAAGPSDDTKREVDGTGDAPAGADREEETGRADCVVCLTNKRELAILPCRHMCVCRDCAAECIQNQDSKCPICRNPAQALLKLTLEDNDHRRSSSSSEGLVS